MSQTIHSKMRSLILADQAMGLTMSPKSLLQTPDSSVAGERACASEAQPIPNQSPAPPQSLIQSPAIQSSPQVASVMQWGITRALPHSLQEREDALQEICARHDATCPLCTTHVGHTRTVLGEGSAAAELVFIGEAPGDKEDATGKPFQGDSGAKLDEMIKAMGMSRQQVFITNVLKCRPRINHTPTAEQTEQCACFLSEQLMVIRPKIIVPMGGPAAKHVLRLDEGISMLRGQWGVWQPPTGCQVEPIPVMPTFHPAYLLRNYTLETRTLMWSDMKLAMTKLSAK